MSLSGRPLGPGQPKFRTSQIVVTGHAMETAPSDLETRGEFTTSQRGARIRSRPLRTHRGSEGSRRSTDVGSPSPDTIGIFAHGQIRTASCRVRAGVKKTSSTKLSKIALKKETITVLRAAELVIVPGGYPQCPNPTLISYIREDCF